MTTYNGFEHDGHNGFGSIGYNARNGGATGYPLYLTSHDGTKGRLVKVFNGEVVWSVDLPDSSDLAHPDLTVNSNGIYTANGYDGSNDNVHRWDRAGTLVDSAKVIDSSGSDIPIASNTLGDVFTIGTTNNTTKFDPDLSVDLTGNTDVPLNLGYGYTRRMACAPDGDVFIARLQSGAGGGHARGWRAADLVFFGGTADVHVLGVRESLNTSTLYTGSAPAFLTSGGEDFGMSMSSPNAARGGFQPGRGKGIDLFTGLLVSETIGGTRTRGAAGFGNTPTYISTTGDTHSYFPSGTKLEHYDDIDDGGGPASVVWSIEVDTIFTSLPTGASIVNIPYGLLPQVGGERAYVWGVSYNTSTNALDAFVGEMDLTDQSEVWLLMNSDLAVGGVFGLTSAPFGSNSGFAITAAVIDQPGEGYSDPGLF